MTISLVSVLVLTCILQIGSIGLQTIQIFSKSLERSPPPTFVPYKIDSSPYSGWPTLASPKSDGSTRPSGGSGMDQEQFPT
jgi:hypothetical protein